MVLIIPAERMGMHIDIAMSCVCVWYGAYTVWGPHRVAYPRPLGIELRKMVNALS